MCPQITTGIRGQATTAISGALETAKKNPGWTATAPRADGLREGNLGTVIWGNLGTQY